MSPYVVTTYHWESGDSVRHIDSRRAVATLDEAKADLRQAVRDADWPSDIYGSNARQSAHGQIVDLMASGGNAIRLPDGVVVEVERVDIREIAYRADFRWQTRRASDVAPEILDAFNAQEATR